jgi:Family of unknown function (DUF6152)
MRNLILIGCLAAPFSALAHHSPAAFDQAAFNVIEGTVVEYTWGNPHVYFSVATTGPDGKPSNAVCDPTTARRFLVE